MKKMFIAVTLILTLGLLNTVFAQANIRYIDSNKILASLPEAQEIQKKLQKLQDDYKVEYQQMIQQYQEMANQLETQNLLLSPEKKAEKQRQLQDLGVRIQQFEQDKFGTQGEFFQKSQELQQPLIEKIQKVVETIAQTEGYDLIIDIATAGLVYIDPKLDVTDKVLDELQKTK
ncbi:MAG: OmpH family outer membrane protein [Calditrichia bacterium]